MSSRVCSQCGGSEIDTDPARGDAVCTNCGAVLEDQIIVSEIQFQDNAMGGSSVIGQYVSAEGGKSHSLGSGFHHGIGKESRQITLQNAKKRIQQLGGQLRLNQHCLDTAFNFFKMALNRRLTRGRRNTHVIAACLYIVCRTEGTPHMLLDFSDVLQVDVYALGRTYLQLSRDLCINIPVLDPCLYIQRFAHKLEFAEKTHDVSMTALRLVSRMKRDWMAQGRRPSGLCGAALLVSARIHNFNRTIKEIIKVVKIGEGTIRKRLSEFEQTPSSQLTVDEFQKIDLEEEMDPPCFTEGRKKAKLAQLEEQGQLPELTNEITELQQEIEAAIEEAASKKASRFKHLTESAAESTVTQPQTTDDLPSIECSKFIEQETLKSVFGVDKDASTDSLQTLSDSIAESIVGSELDPDVAKLEKQEVESLLSTQTTGGVVRTLGPRPTAASLGIKESIEECLKGTGEADTDDGDGELDLSGIDDEEIDNYILSTEEMKTKAKMWFTTNADYLQELKEKAEKEAKDRELGIIKPEQKKKKRAGKKKTKTEAHTAGEAIEKMLAEKKISSKINYDVLKDLNKPAASTSSVPSTPVKTEARLGLPWDSAQIEVSPLTVTPTLGKRFRKPSFVETKTEAPAVKKPKVHKHQIETKQEEVTESAKEVIVESGPVDYDVTDNIVDDYDDECDEDEPISAAQLMGHTEDVEDYGDEDYED